MSFHTIWNLSNTTKIKYFIRPSSSDELRIVFKRFVVLVQLCSHVWLFATSWTEACQASQSFTISRSLFKLMSIELVMPSNHVILCHPFLLLCSLLICNFYKCFMTPDIHKGNAKECSNYRTIALISHASKVMLKTLQARLQQYMNREFTDVQAGFRKGRGTRDQISNICWIIKKAREFQKNIYYFFIDYAKAFDCMDHSKLWKSLKEIGIPGHLTWLLRNLYAGQEATVRTRYGTTDWFQIGKGVH